MDRRTKVAIERFRELMKSDQETQKYDPYAVTSEDEYNRGWADADRILALLVHLVRDAQEELARSHVAWGYVRDQLSDAQLMVILDPTMLDEEALREAELFAREIRENF